MTRARRQSPGALARGLLVLGALAVVAGCGSQTGPATPARSAAGTASPGQSIAEATATAALSPTSTASGSPSSVPSRAGGPQWLAATVEQPTELQAKPSSPPTFCSPCHPLTSTYIDALAVDPAGGYVGLGHVQPPSRAAAWTSIDGRSWQRVGGFPDPDDSLVLAATSQGGPIVAVGALAASGAVWRTDDGTHWSFVFLPDPGGGARERLQAVARTSGGYVAGGFVESAKGDDRATLWYSTDGLQWSTARADASFTGARVTGLAAGTGGLVAVGVVGGSRSGHSVAWRSTDGGRTWQAAPAGALAGGRASGLAAGDGRYVAVGESANAARAMAWTSRDGLAWQAAPDQDSLRHYNLEVLMTSVTGAPDGTFVAAGWQSDAGNGSVVVWRSPDGATWVRLPDDPSFSGGGASSVLARQSIVVGGTTGWPDTHAAMVWVAPAL